MVSGYSVQIMNRRDSRDERRLLELLDAVNRETDLSQRRLAREMGVALGLANSYLKRCVRKGLVKINSAPANRYLYYLTPKGFAEKSRLTAKYLSASFEFYRHAGDSCARVLNECAARRWQKVLLGGVSDLAEIAALRALENGIDIVGIYDRDATRRKLVARPVWRALHETMDFDGCVLTDLSAPEKTYQHLIAQLGDDRVLVPDILRLT